RRLLSDVVALAGLWAAVLGSLAVSAVGTRLGRVVLDALGWPGADWSPLTRVVAALLVSLAADWLILVWMLTRLPRTRRRIHGAGRVALLGAVGLEALKQGLAIYLGRVTGTPGGVIFGSVLGVLVFAYLVARCLLFLTAWAATAPVDREPAP